MDVGAQLATQCSKTGSGASISASLRCPRQAYGGASVMPNRGTAMEHLRDRTGVSRAGQGAVAIGVCAAGAAPALLGPPAGAAPQIARLYFAFGGLVIVCTAVGLALVLRESRARTGTTTGWYVVMLMLVGSQLLWESEARALVPHLATRPRSLTDTALDLSVALLALLLAVLARRGTALRWPVLMAGALVTGGLVARLAAYAVPSRPLPVEWLLLAGAALVGVHVAVAGLMSRTVHLSPGAERRLMTLFVAVGLALAVRGQYVEIPAGTLLANLALSVAAVTWSVGLYVEYLSTIPLGGPRGSGPILTPLSLPLSLAPQGVVPSVPALVPQPRMSPERTQSERLHEVRSTIAGIRAAADLSDDEHVDATARARLRQSMRSELERLARLVSAVDCGEQSHTQLVDLDEQLSTLSDTHRARGRRVEWTPTGILVLGRPDDVRVALNILLENTAVHAEGARTWIEVSQDDRTVEILVRDDGPGIAAHCRDDLFGWGVTGDDRGQGIGLSMARRLLTEQGGSITLIDGQPLLDGQPPGAAFSIRLPAVRQPQDDHVELS